MSWLRAQAFWAYYTAWDTVAQAAKAGDLLNHTIRQSKDGATPVTATNNQVSGNHKELANGEYAILMTATEATSDSLNVFGSSTTAGIAIIPFRTMLLRLPNADPAASAGLPTGASLIASILDGVNDVDTALSLRQALRLITAACAGKTSGLDTLAVAIRNTSDNKTRINATVDAFGNRSAVSYDVT